MKIKFSHNCCGPDTGGLYRYVFDELMGNFCWGQGKDYQADEQMVRKKYDDNEIKEQVKKDCYWEPELIRDDINNINDLNALKERNDIEIEPIYLSVLTMLIQSIDTEFTDSLFLSFNNSEDRIQDSVKQVVNSVKNPLMAHIIDKYRLHKQWTELHS